MVWPCLSLPSVWDCAVSPGPAPSPLSVSSCLPPPSSYLFYRMWESCPLWPADKAHICRMPAIVIRVHGLVKSLAGRISCVLTLVGLNLGRVRHFVMSFLFSPLGEDDGELKLMFTSTMGGTFLLLTFGVFLLFTKCKWLSLFFFFQKWMVTKNEIFF